MPCACHIYANWLPCNRHVVATYLRHGWLSVCCFVATIARRGHPASTCADEEYYDDEDDDGEYDEEDEDDVYVKRLA